MQGIGLEVLGVGSKVQGVGFKVLGVGFKYDPRFGPTKNIF